MKIHTSIGVYLNGSIKTNGVSSKDLEDHINYNKNFRFGRALIIDGKIEHLGYFKKEDLLKLISEKNLKEISIKQCTAPYN